MDNRDYEYLMGILPVGKENAIHQQELADLLGVTPAAAKRQVRKARNELKVPICSGRNGYWLAKDDNERKQFISSMQGQGISRMQSAKALTVDGIKGQMSFKECYKSDFAECTTDDFKSGNECIEDGAELLEDGTYLIVGFSNNLKGIEDFSNDQEEDT